jgi:hypothetical protein
MNGSANGSYTNGGWQDTGQTNILSGGNGSGTVTNMTDAGDPGPDQPFLPRPRLVAVASLTSAITPSFLSPPPLRKIEVSG